MRWWLHRESLLICPISSFATSKSLRSIRLVKFYYWYWLIWWMNLLWHLHRWVNCTLFCDAKHLRTSSELMIECPNDSILQTVSDEKIMASCSIKIKTFVSILGDLCTSCFSLVLFQHLEVLFLLSIVYVCLVFDILVYHLHSTIYYYETTDEEE